MGLLKLHVRDNAEDATAAGSGTLVTIGNMAGNIHITAAHVIAHSPDQGEIALIRFPGRPAQLYRSKQLTWGTAEKLVIAFGDGDAQGPDLGFLRLPMLNVQNLAATNNFLNIGSRHGVEQSAHKGNAHVDAVAGVVSEWTRDVPSLRPASRIKTFELLYCGGTSTFKYQPAAFDLCNFRPDFEPGKKPPASYGGVSGGGLWRTYFVPDGNNQMIENRLVGVAFYERPSANGSLELICHGPRKHL